MARVVHRGLVLAAVAAAPLLLSAKAATPDPAAIIRAAKAASGGAAWDRLTGSYEEGAHSGARYKTWLNYRAYGMRNESVRDDGKTVVIGFDGKVQWRLGPDGVLSVKDDPATLREAVSTAYISNNGYFYPRRFPARLRYVRAADDGGRTYDVVEVEPKGGRAAQLWFDRKSHLLSRIVDPQGPPPVSVELSDRRRVGRVLVAFRGTVRGLDGGLLDEGQVRLVEYRPLPTATFAPPAR